MSLKAWTTKNKSTVLIGLNHSSRRLRLEDWLRARSTLRLVSHFPGLGCQFDSLRFRLQRYPPTFTLDPKEVQELVSPGCPPDLIKLIEDCTQFEPKDRPSMPDVLERLRKMEIEILSRLTIGAGEHVGSIKIVKGKGKGKGKGLEIKTRDLASLFRGKPFDPLGKTGEEGEEKEDFEYDTDEEEVLKMMEGAGSVNGTEVTTYRTARWEEPKESVMSLFANPPSKASEYA